MFWGLVAIVIFLYALWSLNDEKRCKGLPPGPRRFPIVGNMLQVGAESIKGSGYPPEALMRLGRKYGDLMYLDLGAFKAVFTSSYEASVELLNHEHGLRRLPVSVFGERYGGDPSGLFLPVDVWMPVRLFSTRAIKEYGMWKSSEQEQTIQAEVSDFLSFLDDEINSQMKKSSSGGGIDEGKGIFEFSKLIKATMLNNTWGVMTGRRYSLKDERVMRLNGLITELFQSGNFGRDITMSFPILRTLFPTLSGHVRQMECMEKIAEFIKETMEEHKKRVDYAANPLSFVDACLAGMQNQVKGLSTETQLYGILVDIVIAGAETLTSTLLFGTLYMITFPEVQERVQKEIDEVAPNGAIISLDMKKRMPYTTATLMEILRLGTPVPVIPRASTDDIKFGGYIIPKDTHIMVNQFASNYNERTWDEPQIFRPERHLDKDGNLDQKVVSRVLAFGAGPRSCLGQKLGEVVIFLYFSSLLQRYKFRVPCGHPKPSLEHQVGFATQPKPFQVEIERRIV